MKNASKNKITSRLVGRLLACLIFSQTLEIIDAQAQTTSADPIIAASRRIDWAPGLRRAVPNVAQCANVKAPPFNAVGDGVSDDRPAIQAAIDSAGCASGGAVFLPAGKYKVGSSLNIREKSIVIRGEGPSKTTIVGYASGPNVGLLDFRGGGYSQNSVISGYTKDSSSLTLDASTNYSVRGGEYLRLEQDNDPSVIEGTIPSASTPYQTQVIPVRSKIAQTNTLNLARPLYYTYNSTKNVRAKRLWVISNCGVESLTIDMKGSADTNIFMLRAVNCWVYNVQSMNANWHHVALSESYGCEIRHNYFHHAHSYGQSGYGVDIADAATDNLVEDNVFYYLRHSIVVQNGATGNVLGYNYSWRSFDANYPFTNYLMPDLEFHGGNPNMNLFEGNLGMQFDADNYWGSSRNNTYFRNYASRYSLGESSTINSGLWAGRIDAMNLYYNFVGNVMGRPGDTGIIWFTGQDSSNTLGSGGTLTPSPSTTATSTGTDLRVEATMIRHGNVNQIDGTITWEPSIASHSLRNSYYLSSKPSFFGTMSWPSVGPDINGYVQPIPAQKCFDDYWQKGLGPCPDFSSNYTLAPKSPSSLKVTP